MFLQLSTMKSSVRGWSRLLPRPAVPAGELEDRGLDLQCEPPDRPVFLCGQVVEQRDGVDDAGLGHEAQQCPDGGRTPALSGATRRRVRGHQAGAEWRGCCGPRPLQRSRMGEKRGGVGG